VQSSSSTEGLVAGRSLAKAPLAAFSLSEQRWHEEFNWKHHSPPSTAGQVAALLKNAEGVLGLYIWGGATAEGEEVLEQTQRYMLLLSLHSSQTKCDCMFGERHGTVGTTVLYIMEPLTCAGLS
jgi:hypothetical protein